MRVALAVLACCMALGACHKRQPFLRENVQAEPAPRVSVVGRPNFTGDWAASAAQCGARTWTMSATLLRSPDGLVCKIDTLQPASAGFAAYAVCSRDGTPKPTRFVITLVGASPARGMTLSDGPFEEPVSLTRCPGHR